MNFLSLQIYFLTIVFNIIAGFLLCAEYIRDKLPSLKGLLDFLNSKEARFIAGIGSLITGVFKFISPVGIVVIGDIIPALSSLALGVTLLMDFFKESGTFSSDSIRKFDDLLLGHKELIGVIGLTVAVIHFFFAGVPVFL